MLPHAFGLGARSEVNRRAQVLRLATDLWQPAANWAKRYTGAADELAASTRADHLQRDTSGSSLLAQAFEQGLDPAHRRSRRHSRSERTRRMRPRPTTRAKHSAPQSQDATSN